MNWKRCPGEKGTLCGGEEADTERSGKEVGREQPQAPAAICTKPFAGGYLALARGEAFARAAKRSDYRPASK